MQKNRNNSCSVGLYLSAQLLLCVIAVCALVSCTKPMLAPPEHSGASAPTTESCKSAPSIFGTKPDPRDKMIKEQADLLKLYEEKIRTLETKLREKGTTP